MEKRRAHVAEKRHAARTRCFEDWIVLGRGEMELHKKLALRSDEIKLIKLLRAWNEDSTKHLFNFLDDLKRRR